MSGWPDRGSASTGCRTIWQQILGSRRGLFGPLPLSLGRRAGLIGPSFCMMEVPYKSMQNYVGQNCLSLVLRWPHILLTLCVASRTSRELSQLVTTSCNKMMHRVDVKEIEACPEEEEEQNTMLHGEKAMMVKVIQNSKKKHPQILGLTKDTVTPRFHKD